MYRVGWVFSLACCVSLCLNVWVECITPSPFTLRAAPMINAIDNFYKLRTSGSGKGNAIWYYTGSIRNPMTGNEVVGVEGIEAVMGLQHFQKLARVRNDTTAERNYVSKKLFVYTDLYNRSSLVEKYRVRHHSPLRDVSPIKTFAEMVTVGIDQNGKNYAAIRWPGSGREMQTKRISIEPALDQSLLAKLLGHRKLNVVHFITGSNFQRKQDQPHKWSRWISVRPSSTDPSAGRSQEYYTIESGPGNAATVLLASTLRGQSADRSPLAATAAAPTALRRWVNEWLAPRPGAVLSYRRYGEGPPWYAVGRPCVTEVKGYRYGDARCLPKHVQEWVHRVDPTFFDFSVLPKPTTGSAGAGTVENDVRDDRIGKRRQQSKPVHPQTAPVAAKPGRRTSAGQMSLEWFLQQSDPADAYKAWYTILGNALRSGWSGKFAVRRERVTK